MQVEQDIFNKIKSIEEDYRRYLFQPSTHDHKERLINGIKKYRDDVQSLLTITKYLLIKLNKDEK